MIEIINVGRRDDDPHGLCDYEVAINSARTRRRTRICGFQHKRKDGLATCLRRAAKAVQEQLLFEDNLASLGG